MQYDNFMKFILYYIHCDLLRKKRKLGSWKKGKSNVGEEGGGGSGRRKGPEKGGSLEVHLE